MKNIIQNIWARRTGKYGCMESYFRNLRNLPFEVVAEARVQQLLVVLVSAPIDKKQL